MAQQYALVAAIVVFTVSSPLLAGARPQSARLTNRIMGAVTLESQMYGFFELLQQAKFTEATKDFTPAMKTALPASQLQTVWQGLIQEFGTLKSTQILRTETGPGNRVVSVKLEFQKGNQNLRMVFDRQQQIAGLAVAPPDYQAPAYVRPTSFLEREMQIGTGKSALPATFTLPVGKGAFPVVVLVHGSGPQDRDESMGPNKPFRDLAWGLASQGIAVLRYDKRTKVYPQSFGGTFTVKEETVDDAIVAVTQLRQVKEINPRKIFVLGHSLGGMMIPRIGKLDPTIAGLIVLAGNTRPFEDLLLEQTAYLISLDGSVSPEETAYLEALKRSVAKVRSPQLSQAKPAELLLGIPASYWLDLQGYYPPAVAKTLKQPLLILQGERDYQVTLADFQGWKTGLSGKQNVTFKTYTKLNHLFMPGEVKSNPEEYQVPGHVAKAVIDDIAAWIKS